MHRNFSYNQTSAENRIIIFFSQKALKIMSFSDSMGFPMHPKFLVSDQNNFIFCKFPTHMHELAVDGKFCYNQNDTMCSHQ